MNTNKPLSEWTLGEAQKYCKSVGCTSCKIGNGHCPLNGSPNIWYLSESPRWTDDEIKFAEIFKLACKNEIFFERLKGSQILLWGEVGIDPTANAVLPYKLLPSLKEGERVTLDKIIGGGE